ncbi:FxSxx-COOH system tetratricopeptide repeat protein [[Kitasatospora] papulosa]|uniref:FxSxx-COOH system tetratricopeptide repeat protein n=3 Tax=[Kitasatospora] papulosa TaxID=1464011 RepID=UPI0036CCC317
MTVGDGGVGAGRDVSHNAFGQGSQVVDNRQTHIHHTPREVTWPLEVGTVPGLASAFQPRSALRDQVDAARAQGSAAVLTQVLSGGGGVGKSQLAAAYAGEALRDGTDLVLWASAVEVQQVVTLYAQAAVLVAAPGTTGADPERDARALLSWLATTNRRWLVVLDDITDPTAIRGWWPASRTGSGWVLATTRLHDASLTGNGRRRVRVDVYTPVEAASYLRTRLTDDEAGHLLDDTVDELAAALGYLPLALGHAAAYMLNQDLTCTRYLKLYNDSSRRLHEVLPEAADADGYGRQIATTLLLSLDAAQRTEPAGLARAALQVAAYLDPAGHPYALWNTPAVLAHLTAHRAPAPAPDAAEDAPDVTAEEAEAVLRVLHRYALITNDRRQEPRAVRIHALTARAIRETTPVAAPARLAHATAEALLGMWPDPDVTHPGLAAALRTNTDHLHRHTSNHLLQHQVHPVLYRAGNSLLYAGLASAAVAYWDTLSDLSQQILGSDHLQTLTTRNNLAQSYWQAGRTSEAIAVHEAVLTDQERLLGSDHPDTLTTRNNLAQSYRQAGRTSEAIAVHEAVLTDRERVLGPDHPHTLSSRNNLALAYGQAGRTAEATPLHEAVLAGIERVLGPDNPDTLTTRENLALAYGQAGRTSEAIAVHEAVLTDQERLLGPDHPQTLTTRNNLAASYWQAGRTSDAIAVHEAVLTDQERLLGPDHPQTLTTRNNLATSYWQAGRTSEAITLLETVRTGQERVLGFVHPETLTTRNNLAISYWQAGRTSEAITLLETVLTDRERVLGRDHPHTLTTRNNLAASYWQAGRTSEAVTLLEAVLSDLERVLGSGHPDTLIARDNLAAMRRSAGS